MMDLLHPVCFLGERPFQCVYCDYSSSQKTHLTRHMRTHSGESLIHHQLSVADTVSGHAVQFALCCLRVIP